MNKLFIFNGWLLFTIILMIIFTKDYPHISIGLGIGNTGYLLFNSKKFLGFDTESKDSGIKVEK